jgi:hypothetical protein
MRIVPVAALSSALLLGTLAWSQAGPDDATSPSKAASKLDELAWLAGAWSVQDGPSTVEEHWIAPKGGLMLGVGRTVAGDKARMFEFLRIEERKGEVAYIAQPGGGKPTSFQLTGSADGTWTFENPEHDFPRVIRYARRGENAVTATISDGTDARSIEFRYERVAAK